MFGGGRFHLAILFCHFNPNPKFREFHMCIHLCDLTPYRYLAGSIMHLSCHFPLPHLPILCTQTSSLCSSVSQGLTSGQTVPHTHYRNCSFSPVSTGGRSEVIFGYSIAHTPCTQKTFLTTDFVSSRLRRFNFKIKLCPQYLHTKGFSLSVCTDGLSGMTFG